MDYTSLESYVKNRLKESRFLHTMGVVEMAEELGVRFSLDQDKARRAAVFHDAERYSFDEKSALLLERAGIPVFPEEMEAPMLLHAPLAALKLKELDPDVEEDVLLAIRHHTLGHKDMGALGAVIYISDFAEKGRRHIREEERHAIIQLDSLEGMVMWIISKQRKYFEREGIKEAMVTSELYDFLKSGGRFV